MCYLNVDNKRKAEPFLKSQLNTSYNIHACRTHLHMHNSTFIKTCSFMLFQGVV